MGELSLADPDCCIVHPHVQPTPRVHRFLHSSRARPKRCGVAFDELNLYIYNEIILVWVFVRIQLLEALLLSSIVGVSTISNGGGKERQDYLRYQQRGKNRTP